MILLKLFLSLFVPVTAGYVLLNFLFRKKFVDMGLKLALGYGLGLGLLAQWMLFLGMTGIPFSERTIGLPLIAIILLFSFLILKEKHSCPQQVRPTFQSQSPLVCEENFLIKIILSLFYLLTAVYITYYTLFIFWEALSIPMIRWDTIATHGFKAKVFFYEGSLSQLKNLHSSSYPLLVPFTLTWIAFNLGQWHEQLPQIIFPLALLSYLVIHYRFLMLYTNRRWALLGIVLLMTSNFFNHLASISYCDFFLLYYNCTAILLLLIWHKKRDDAWLILASLFAGFMTFTKLEGTAYLLIVTILFFLILHHQRISIKEIKSKLIKFILPAFSMCLIYYAYKVAAGIPTTGREFSVALANLEVNKISDLISKLSFNLFLTGNWSLVWFLFVLSLLNIDRIKRHFEARLVILAIMLYFGLYFFAGLLTDNWISHVTVLSRVILHFFPLSTVVIILINGPSRTD